MQGFWRRHRRKIFVAAGALGCGYALYKLYDLHKTRLIEIGREAERKQNADELVRVRLQNHFEDIQRTLETTILPSAMSHLRTRIAEELDISLLIEKLMQGKGQASNLQPSEKRELWERLKFLSFTRTTTSLWAMVTLFLYVRVQFNILGRQLYLETARGFGVSEELDEADPFDRRCQQEFIETANYLSNYGIHSLILKMENATFEILKDKQLGDPFSQTHVAQTIMEILLLFMNSMSPDYWISCVIPESAAAYQQLLVMSSNGSDNSSIVINTNKLDQLITEARLVLSSVDFRNIILIAMEKVVNGLMEDLAAQLNNANPSGGLPLAKLLPRVAGLGSAVLEETSDNKFIRDIRGLPEVELFYTHLFANLSQPQHPQIEDKTEV